MTTRFRRVLLKLSGEALMGDQPYGISQQVLFNLADEIGELRQMGIELALVIGGGNIFRGAHAAGMDRVSADHMGMLATLINSLALQDALEQRGRPNPGPRGDRDPAGRRAVPQAPRAAPPGEGARRDPGRGDGEPVLHHRHRRRAARDGDPRRGADQGHEGGRGLHLGPARRSWGASCCAAWATSEVLERGLKVMDNTAISLCMDNALPIIVFNVRTPGNLRRILLGEEVGSTVGETVR